MFNEDRLRKEIGRIWGPNGIHAAFYSDLLCRVRELETALKSCEVLVDSVFQETGDQRFKHAGDAARKALENDAISSSVEGRAPADPCPHCLVSSVMPGKETCERCSL